MAGITAYSNEPLEKILKRFKKAVEKEGIIREWKQREFYEKPSIIRNRKKRALERKIAKKVRRNNRYGS